MASFADDIAAKIIASSLGTAVGTDIFLGSSAAIPLMKSGDLAVGPYISIIDTGGTAAIRSHSGKYPRPSLQIMVRAASGAIAKARAEAIHEAIGDLFNVTLGTRFYLEVSAVQEVLDMQKEEGTGRSRFGFNVNVISRQ